MKNFICLLSLTLFALLCSCSSDDVKSSENYILKFEITGATPVIRNDQNMVYIWTEKDAYEALISKVPQIEVSENAKLERVGENWFEGYIVTAENGDPRHYSIEIDTTVPRKFSFDFWSYSKANDKGYYIPSGSNSRWTSGNAGISMALGALGRNSDDPESYPTRRTSEGYSGYAVLMETIEGGIVQLIGKNIPLFSGNLILGNFNLSKAMSDELAAIELGHPYPAKPKSVKGYYKYKEGPGVFSNNGTLEHGRSDICSMNAFFYRSDLPSGKDTILTVKDIDDSDLLIAEARMQNCVATDGEDFKVFELNFVYKSEPDFANYRYKLAMTFAASKDGDSYAGKIGSKLIVDEVEFEDF